MVNKKILVVEDEMITAETIKMTLQKLGYEISGIANSKKEALQMAEKNVPDLVLMDIRLHGKMDGIEAAEQIRSRFGIPVVYLTAHADKDTLTKAKITDPFGYILKPFEKRELHTAVEIALSKHNMEKKLKQTQEWLSATLKNIGDAVIATDKQGRVTFLNLKAEVLTGWKKEDALGKSLVKVFPVVPEKNGQKVKNPVKAVTKEKAVLNLTNHLLLKNREGKSVPIELKGAPVVDERGNVAEVVLAFRDISERLQIKEELKNSQASFNSIVGKSADGIVIVDRKGNIQFINPTAKCFLRKNKGETIGKKFDYPLGADKSAEIEINRRNGKKGTGEMRIVESEWENASGYLVLIRDISERKHVIEELEKAHQQQIHTRDQFLSHISHELRNPLSVIHQFVSILLDGLDGDLTPVQKEDLEIIMRNAGLLSTMIRDLLDVTRAITGRLTIDPQPISVAETASRTIKTFHRKAATQGIFLYSEIPSDLPSVYADPERIRQILGNMIDNAIKFTSENETIAVRASLYPKNPGCVRIEVADTGPGINPDEMGKIFNYMYQAEESQRSKKKGLGLGLFICKEIVSRHGGDIWVESEPGHGSTFYFTLPVFSLTRLLAPILTPESLKQGFLSMVTVIIPSPARPIPPKIWENIVHVVKDILQGLLFSDSEVLLPRASIPQSGAKFFIVAAANRKETQGIVKRIQGQLGLCDILQNTGIEPAISYSVMDISRRDLSTKLDKIAKKVTGRMEREIKNYLSEQGGYR
jgi:PAS domain S-box-containing protein